MKQIDSWNIFATHMVAIEIHSEEGQFRPALNFFLNDGSELSDDSDEQAAVGVFVDKLFDSAEEAAKFIAATISQVFESISVSIPVFSEDGELLEQLDLEKLFNSKKKKSSKAVFH